MPSRQNIQRFISTEVQGDDSWVDIRSITLGEAEDMRRLQPSTNGHEPKPDEQEAMEAKLYDRMSTIVVRWNWVNDTGDPLAQPLNNPAVFKELTIGEMNFISDCLTPKTEKNSKRR